MSVIPSPKSLIAENIFYHFKNEEKNTFFWKNFNFKVQQGEVVSLLGSSGIGKTTLLRVLSGLHPIEQGQVFIDEVSNLVKQPEAPVFVVFQDYGFTLLPWLTIKKNIALGRFKTQNQGDIDYQEIKRVLFPTRYNFEKFLNQYPNQLSGGQKQRVQIARAMVSASDFIFFDEPDSGIDYKSKLAIRALLQQLAYRNNKGIVLITHDLESAYKVSNKAYVLHKELVNNDIKLIELKTADYSSFEIFREKVNFLL